MTLPAPTIASILHPAHGRQPLVYFIGAGGIGMSSLARYFRSRGVQVHGYDRTRTALTKQLEEEGVVMHYDENVQAVPAAPDLVVYTPAIPATHAELLHCREQGYPLLKRSDVLQLITESSLNICVAGTHGKTTISTMTAHLLRHSGYGCNAFLGGISVNYGTNFWSHPNGVCVVEADEYDRSFLKLRPDMAVITSMDPDHLDIYGTPAEMEEAFIAFSKRIKPDGWLIAKHGLSRGAELQARHLLTYDLENTAASIHTRNLEVKEGGYCFDVCLREEDGTVWSLRNLRLQAGGLHNVENLLPAIAAARILHIGDEAIRAAVAAYQGVKRRFEYILPPEEGGLVFIDDYAHHPEELQALIRGVRSLFAGYRLVLVFQPHLFSRTRDLAEGFAVSIDKADTVVLLPVYPARELPVPGVTSELIRGHMRNTDVYLWNREELAEKLHILLPEEGADVPTVLVTAGAGDIDALLPELKNRIKTMYA